MSTDNIVLNSCQYTPVYFIGNPGVNQARSYVLAPNNQSADQPVSESLKRFYENSGNLESNLTVTDDTIKQRISKKNDSNAVGNNLKLATFLLPKCETKNEIIKPTKTPVNSVVLKPVYIANNASVNNVKSSNLKPKIDVNSRLVKLKDLPDIVRTQNGKILPKIKPKEQSLSSKQKQTQAQVAQTIQPVQLVKFGETYHSLNQLSTDQMKMVAHALKMLSTKTNPPGPAYDPATNTKFIYKVISQKDFAEQNKLAKQFSAEIKQEPIKLEQPEYVDEEEEKIILETKVTRSGRVVKLPKNIIVDDSLSKRKKQLSALVACLQCNSKFSSPQRLHRHYENHPSHIPSNLHNNLFHCLVAIVSAGSGAERGNILLQQLQLLITRLQACVPCLLNKDDGTEHTSVISDDLSRLFGINSGKYNLNIEALCCEKDKDGYCSHNPRPQINVYDNIKPQEILANVENDVSEGPRNILKVNFQERRPKILRKMECRKQKLEHSSPNVNRKKIKLAKDVCINKNSNSIELNDLVTILSDTEKTDNMESKGKDKVILNDLKEVNQGLLPAKVVEVVKPPHIQFHSAHFDIRSSPIKPTSTVFRKFQINPEKMTKFIEVVHPIHLNQIAEDVAMTNNLDSKINTQEIFSDTNVITSTESEDLYYTSKNWCEDPLIFMKPNDLIHGNTNNFIKPNAAIEPSLIHVKNGTEAHVGVNESLLDQVESNSEVANIGANSEKVLASNIFKNDSQENKVMSQTGYSNPSILIEPLAPNNHKITTKTVCNHIDSNDFIKSDILTDQALLNTQDSKVVDENTNRNNDFFKSTIQIEPAFINGREKLDKFADKTNSFITSNIGTDQTFPHININSENGVTGVTESNEIEVDLNVSQGQSIISFLESLGNELAYADTETDSRNNGDFQLDLFEFNNS